jgi:hypothetical protein
LPSQIRTKLGGTTTEGLRNLFSGFNKAGDKNIFSIEFGNPILDSSLTAIRVSIRYTGHTVSYYNVTLQGVGQSIIHSETGDAAVDAALDSALKGRYTAPKAYTTITNQLLQVLSSDADTNCDAAKTEYARELRATSGDPTSPGSTPETGLPGSPGSSPPDPGGAVDPVAASAAAEGSPSFVFANSSPGRKNNRKSRRTSRRKSRKTSRSTRYRTKQNRY